MKIWAVINVAYWVHILPQNSFYEDFFCHVNMWQHVLLMSFHPFVKERCHNEETVFPFIFTFACVSVVWCLCACISVGFYMLVGFVCATELDKFHWELIGRKILTCGYICLTVPHTLAQLSTNKYRLMLSDEGILEKGENGVEEK